MSSRQLAGETALRASLMGSELAGTVTAHPMAGHGYDYDVPRWPDVM